MDEGCLFCKLYAENNNILFQTPFFYARFDPFPVSPGHSEIISKRHFSSTLNISGDEWADLFIGIKQLTKVISLTNLQSCYLNLLKQPINEKSEQYCRKMLVHRGLNQCPEGYNFGINDGEVAGQTVNHFHFHVIPRYLGDVLSPRGGIRNIIPGLGDYKL